MYYERAYLQVTLFSDGSGRTRSIMLLSRLFALGLVLTGCFAMCAAGEGQGDGGRVRVFPKNHFSHHDCGVLDQLFTNAITADEDGRRRLHSPVRRAQLASAPYAEWAHHHWVWLSNDRASQAAMRKYTQEYLNHSIPVGAVDFDSRWEAGFNNFKFNTDKYPNGSALVEWYHSQSIKVIFWITSMVDVDSDNYDYGDEHDYYIKDVVGKSGKMKWWHGTGSLLDYTNPDAKKWWHDQMDKVLDLGIDGWKCDGTDPYILELIYPRGKGGHVTYRDYADSYYGDFLDHTRAVRGIDGLIMSRPVDSFGPLYLKFSPRRVMFSGWVGDADPTFKGLTDTLKRYLQSAWAGYANFGSDIGGYRSGNGSLGRTKELFVRWAQVGAFSPLMENGGNKEHRPWKFDEGSTATPTVEEIYRDLVATHYQLVPYLLTTGTLAYEKNRSSIEPLAPHDDFINKLIDDFDPPTFNYMLGSDVLVAPVTSNPARVNVTFPHVKGNDTYIAWWNKSLVYKAGHRVSYSDVPLEFFPVFHRAGVLFPLRPRPNPTEPFANVPQTDWLQLHVYHPTSERPSPLQVVDRGSGLVSAYWRTKRNATSSSERVQFTCTAHADLRISVHWHFSPDDVLNPCNRRTSIQCTRAGDQQNASCTSGTPLLEYKPDSDPGRLFDDRWFHHARRIGLAAYAVCHGGHGDIVHLYGNIQNGVEISLDNAV